MEALLLFLQQLNIIYVEPLRSDSVDKNLLAAHVDKRVKSQCEKVSSVNNDLHMEDCWKKKQMGVLSDSTVTCLYFTVYFSWSRTKQPHVDNLQKQSRVGPLLYQRYFNDGKMGTEVTF